MRLLLGFGICLTAWGAATFESAVAPALRKYCAGCHGNVSKPAGNVRLASFADEGAMRKDLALWSKVLDVVRAGQMPPPNLPKPSAAEREGFVAFVEDVLENPKPGERIDPGRPVMRRLTRLEYNNTVRDLLGLNTDLFMFPERLPILKSYFQPWAGKMPPALDVDLIEYGQKIPVLLRYTSLPGENKAEYGFTNRGDSLNVSPLLFEQYMAVAGEIVGHPELADRSTAIRLLTAPPGNRPRREVAGERLRPFLERAFRRPAEPGDVEPYLKAFDAATARGAAFEAAMKAAVRAVITSPRFVMRMEPPRGQGGARPLDDYELASRLSYFLWASMPDTELFDLARQGLLSDPAVLETQARRMMRDPKVRELSDTFAIQWLQLNELFGAQPDVDKFKRYYQYDVFGTNKGNLAMDMIIEALLLFETVMVEDRGVLEFIDAPYTWVNTKLMKHYGLEDRYPKQVKEAAQFGTRKGPSRWFKVQLPDRTRGGFMTMGGVLTMTSTPVRTSPVIRGAWILEAVFNRPPPPPPNVNVGTIEEQGGDDAKLTVRQKLEMHRKNPACASCHNRMDPLGFALEGFDPIGGWRTHDGASPVDTSGELSHGRKFQGPTRFKDALLARREEFVRGFAEQLLSYALGRKLEYYDAPAVKRIVADAGRDGYRFSSIVAGIVKSTPFRNTRNTAGDAAQASGGTQ